MLALYPRSIVCVLKIINYNFGEIKLKYFKFKNDKHSHIYPYFFTAKMK